MIKLQLVPQAAALPLAAEPAAAPHARSCCLVATCTDQAHMLRLPRLLLLVRPWTLRQLICASSPRGCCCLSCSSAPGLLLQPALTLGLLRCLRYCLEVLHAGVSSFAKSGAHASDALEPGQPPAMLAGSSRGEAAWASEKMRLRVSCSAVDVCSNSTRPYASQKPQHPVHLHSHPSARLLPPYQRPHNQPVMQAANQSCVLFAAACPS